MSILEKMRSQRLGTPEAPPAEPPAPETLVENFPQVIETDPDGIARRLMDSKVLGAVVPISWTPDGGTVLVDGISYSAKEIGELMTRHPDAATMRNVHELKRTFQGAIQ